MDGFYNFLEENSIYIVLFIVLVIWFGIFWFLSSSEKRIKEIEKEIAEKNHE